MSYLLIRGNSLNLPLADRSVQMCATSPPYWSLRDYGLKPNWWPEVSYAPMPGLPPLAVPAMACCLGLEPTPEAFVGHLVLVFREVRRVLRDDGVAFVNLGDTYNAYNGNRGASTSFSANVEEAVPGLPAGYGLTAKGLKPKDRVGIPHRVVFALQADGWTWRDEICWAKPSPMPESVTDRTTKAHEMVFLLSKQDRYFYDADAIREEPESKDPRVTRPSLAVAGDGSMRSGELETLGLTRGKVNQPCCNPMGRNKRSVWWIATQPTPDAHFATWPADLVRPMILAGTSERGCCPACSAPCRRIVAKDRQPTRPGVGSKVYVEPPVHPDSPVRQHHGIVCGNRDPRRHTTVSRTVGWEASCSCGAGDPTPCVVLDPFNGSGTTGEVARLLGRSYVGVDANPKYLSEIATRRVERGDRPHKGEAVAARPADLPGQLTMFPAPEPTTR